ncbi:MAG: urea ABC transporter ATP-binding protein UrtD [Candidatus Aquicultorales bacterium]
MGESILDLKDISVSFDGFKAVDRLNFTVDAGELRFLIGPNGAGKTTLLDVVCGRVDSAGGGVFFMGDIDIGRLHEHQIARMGIGRKFQTPSIYANLSVYENLELALKKNKGVLSSLFRSLTDEQERKIFTSLERIRLVDKASYKAGSLSHGEKQWLEIGMLLVQEPELLLLDEPVAGMSNEETEKTGELLRDIVTERTVVVVEHDMEFVRSFASKVSVMHEGKILCEGLVDQVQADPRVIEVYLGRGEKGDVKN